MNLHVNVEYELIQGFCLCTPVGPLCLFVLLSLGRIDDVPFQLHLELLFYTHTHTELFLVQKCHFLYEKANGFDIFSGADATTLDVRKP